MKSFIQHNIFPVLAAIIWGLAFSAQSICSQFLPPFAINAFRSLLAFIVLALVCIIFRVKIGERKFVIAGSLICGFALYAATNFQQFGISETSAGKSGFITALYIVLVPVFSFFVFRKKTSARVWLAVIIAIIGMYFLCINGSFSVGAGDIALFMCAILFAAQILSVDYYSQYVHPIALSAGEFLVSGILSLICSLIFESVHASDFAQCILPLLYISLLSSCVAYTLQIFAQKGGNATVVTLLLSLESVFALLGGMLLLGEKPTARELLGCLLMAIAVVICQLPEKSGGNEND